MDITHVLNFGWPDTSWALDGEQYEGLRWFDEYKPKPTLAEIEAKHVEFVAAGGFNNLTPEQEAIELLLKNTTVANEAEEEKRVKLMKKINRRPSKEE